MRIPEHIILLLLPFSANAQLLTNNGAVVTSTFGSIVAVNGSVLNQGATGVLDNSGSIVISGDFTHDAPNICFGTSTGEVVLNGATQNIGGSNVAVFNHLELVGTGTKTLLQDVEVGGAYATPAGGLFVNTQNLDLGTHQLTVRNADPTAITRNTGFIVSETDPNAGYSYVRWDIGSGTGTYTIPFGNAATGNYLPFTASITAPGSGATGYIRMATYPTATLASPNNRPLPAGMPSLVDVSGTENAANVLDRWWVLESGNYSSAPVANATFTYRDSEWSTGTNTIVEGALQLERQQGTWTMMPTVTNVGANTLTAMGVSLGAAFWTAAEMSSPLPVELLAFSGQRINADLVELEWTTASEHHNAGFEVWRMVEGEDGFTEVAWVDGAGDSQTLQRYALPDANATRGTSYYKLKQVDLEGTATWSPVIAVEGMADQRSMLAYPNPASDRIMLAGMPDDVTHVDLLDAAGRAVRTWGGNSQLDDLGGLERGMYTVVVSAANGVTSLRVVLE